MHNFRAGREKLGKFDKKIRNRDPYFLLQNLDSRHSQLAKYTVLDEESESEVKKYKILEPGGEK